MKIKLTKNKTLSNFSKPYIIAEIGSNHNGDINLAKKMIKIAKEKGADCAKFQSFNDKSLISEEEYDNKKIFTDDPNKHWGSLKEMVKAYYLKEEEHYELARYCKSIGIDFCSTPFSIEEVDLLEKINVKFYKIASCDLNNLELIKYIAKIGKPIILSTGMGTLGEIEDAVRVIENTGNKNIILLHCIAIYPPKNVDINLNNIKMLQKAFKYPIGFSDHSIGTTIPLSSVVLGSCLIEKHFTLDKNLKGWDHKVSCDPEELEFISKESKIISEALGSYERTVSSDEQEKKIHFRKSIVLKRDYKKGEKINSDDILFKRPGYGITPNEKKYVAGRMLKNDIRKDYLISWDDFV